MSLLGGRTLNSLEPTVSTAKLGGTLGGTVLVSERAIKNCESDAIETNSLPGVRSPARKKHGGSWAR